LSRIVDAAILILRCYYSLIKCAEKHFYGCRKLRIDEYIRIS